MGVAATIRRRRGADARYRTALYLLLAPFLLGVVVLVVLPVALSIGLAFTAYDGLSAPEWRGLGNFRELAADPLFRIALRNSLRLRGAHRPAARADRAGPRPAAEPAAPRRRPLPRRRLRADRSCRASPTR